MTDVTHTSSPPARLPPGHRPAHERVTRLCPTCGQTDDHPRHGRGEPDGSVLWRHMDCCAGEGCSVCTLTLSYLQSSRPGEPNLRGLALADALHPSPDPALHERYVRELGIDTTHSPVRLDDLSDVEISVHSGESEKPVSTRRTRQQRAAEEPDVG